MIKRKVFSINTELFKVTGVQKVMMDIHHAVQDDYEAKIVGTLPFDKIHEDHHIEKHEYVKWSSPFMFRNSIVIVHERKLLGIFWILNHLLFQKIKIVYVHHNEFHNLKWLTILPKCIVAISDRGIKNLVEYFEADSDRIHKIHNCVMDSGYKEKSLPMSSKITLLLPARINAQKQQLEIVKQLTGKIGKEIEIQFAGIGPSYESLKANCEGKDNFEVLGFRSDVIELLRKSDYMFMYSVHEGLPITLIEATMTGTPIICSDVGGNPEICHHGENGWVIDNWEDLIKTLNSLKDVTPDRYRTMSYKSREIYERYFSFDVFKSNYLKLLKSL